MAERSDGGNGGKLIGIVTHVRGSAEQIDTVVRVERARTAPRSAYFKSAAMKNALRPALIAPAKVWIISFDEPACLDESGVILAAHGFRSRKIGLRDVARVDLVPVLDRRRCIGERSSLLRLNYDNPRFYARLEVARR